MSGSDRGDRGALIALTLVVIAVVIVALFGGASEPFNQVVGQPASDYIKTSQNGDVAQSITSSNNFNPWLDSYAQWIMAGLSLVATGVSIWAVLFLRGTLRETQETNRIQNEAVKWQRRALSASEGPSLVVTKMSVSFNKVNKSFDFSTTIKNEGKTSAFVKSIWVHQSLSKTLPKNPNFFDMKVTAGTIGKGNSLVMEFGRIPEARPLINQAMFDAINEKRVIYYNYYKITFVDLYGTIFEWGLLTAIESETVEGGVRFRLIEPAETGDLTYLREIEET